MTALQERPAAIAAPAPAPVAPPRPARPARVGIAICALVSLAVVTLWVVFYALVVSALQHTHDQSVLYGQLREELALGTAPLGGAIAPGSPVALLNLPAAGVHDEIVVEGTAARDLMNGPGHRRDSPLPGQAGTSLVYGRAKLFGGPFHRIASVRIGSVITVVTGEGTAKYVVTRVRHAGDAFSPPLAAGAGRLTLVSSESTGWRSGWAPARAVYVDADLTTKPFVQPAGLPAGVPRAETAMHGDPSVLFALVLDLPLLLAAAVLVVVAHHRWGRWQTWVVGFPVVLATLWAVTQEATQLLPNLM